MQQVVPSPPLRGPRRYEITLAVPVWTALEIQLGTHLRKPSGLLSLRILDPSGRELRKSAVELSPLIDCTFVRFEFDRIEDAHGRRFVLEFELTGQDPQTLISIF